MTDILPEKKRDGVNQIFCFPERVNTCVSGKTWEEDIIYFSVQFSFLSSLSSGFTVITHSIIPQSTHCSVKTPKTKIGKNTQGKERKDNRRKSTKEKVLTMTWRDTWRMKTNRHKDILKPPMWNNLNTDFCTSCSSIIRNKPPPACALIPQFVWWTTTSRHPTLPLSLKPWKPWP